MTTRDMEEQLLKDMLNTDYTGDAPIWICQLAERIINKGWIKSEHIAEILSKQDKTNV